VFSVKPFTRSRSEEGCHRAQSGQGQGAPPARGPSLTSPARVPAGRSGRRDDRLTIEQRDDGCFWSRGSLKSSQPFCRSPRHGWDRTAFEHAKAQVQQLAHRGSDDLLGLEPPLVLQALAQDQRIAARAGK
jgi:hypothetical protein